MDGAARIRSLLPLARLRRFPGRGYPRKVDFGIGDSVDIIGQDAERDMGDDFGDLAIRVPSGPDLLDIGL